MWTWEYKVQLQLWHRIAFAKWITTSPLPEAEWLGPLYVFVSLQQPSLPSWVLANHRTLTLPGGWSQSPYPSKVPSVKSCCVPLFLSFTLKKCCIHLKFIFELPVLLILLLLSLMNSLGFYHDCLSHRAHFVLHGYMTEIPRGSGGEVALPSIATVGKHCIVVFFRPKVPVVSVLL